jgi:hypothetical protein
VLQNYFKIFCRYSKEPKFLKKPRSTEALEGDNIVILCEVIGDPKPEVVWLRDFLKVRQYFTSARIYYLRIMRLNEHSPKVITRKLDKLNYQRAYLSTVTTYVQRNYLPRRFRRAIVDNNSNEQIGDPLNECINFEKLLMTSVQRYKRECSNSNISSL